MSRWWLISRQTEAIWRGEWLDSRGSGDALSEVDVVYLKNVLLKFISAQSTGKTTVSLWTFSAGPAALHIRSSPKS